MSTGRRPHTLGQARSPRASGVRTVGTRRLTCLLSSTQRQPLDASYVDLSFRTHPLPCSLSEENTGETLAPTERAAEGVEGFLAATLLSRCWAP